MRILATGSLTILGVVLLVTGLDGTGSLGDRLSGLFTGPLTNVSMWMFTLGAIAVFTGMFLAYSRKPGVTSIATPQERK